MTRVAIKPELLQWARQRSGQPEHYILNRFPKLEKWESGTELPTLHQIESFAKAVHTPIGYLFLPKPPVEFIPLPDFRTARNSYRLRPSPELLETIYICQQRQEWYRDHMRSIGEPPLSFVGSVTTRDDIVNVANTMRDSLGFNIEHRYQMTTWTDALRHFINQSDDLGILVMCSGVVLNNNRRKLNTDEFRGFAISDNLAPLIFINGADSKAAQMFTLAHELAHIWLGQTAISDSQAHNEPDQDIEDWCNRVAAEMLVPLSILKEVYRPDTGLEVEVSRLARYFKVSTLVILRRIYDAGGINREDFWRYYEEELDRIRNHIKAGGGNFYLTQSARVSKRFARALVVSTLEGQTLHRDAFRLLGFSKLETFHELGRSLGVIK